MDSVALIDSSVKLFVNRDPMEKKQMRESDLRRDMLDVKAKLEALANSTLLSSFTFYREGIRRLLKLKKNSNEGDRESADRQTEVRSTSLYQVCNDLRLHCLDDADKRALAAAKDDFKQARIKAVEAFSNEGVEILDRMQAMVIRVASTMLENVDHPEDALNVCIGCLEDLHGLKYVRETFNQVVYKGLNKGSFKRGVQKQVIASVCRINHFIRNAALAIAKEGELLVFALIEVEKGKIDPLSDSRVAKEVPHVSLTPSTLNEEDGKNKPNIPQGIAVNSQGHCMVGDEWDLTVKEYDANGLFVRKLSLTPWQKDSVASIVDVATDTKDNVYVLFELGENSTTAHFKIFVFDKGSSHTRRDILLKEKTAEVSRMSINNNNEIFILAKSSSGIAVDVYDSSDGHFKTSFGEKILNPGAEDICATNDGRVIVLDKDDKWAISAHMFRSDGHYIDDLLKSVEKKRKRVSIVTKHELRSSIACHQVSNNLVIALPSQPCDKGKEWNPVRILRYDMSDGGLLPSIFLHDVKGFVSIRGVAVTLQGRIAVGLLDKDGGDSKIFVV